MINILKKIYSFKPNLKFNYFKKISLTDERSKYVLTFLTIITLIFGYKFILEESNKHKINFKNDFTIHEDFLSTKKFLQKIIKSPYKNINHKISKGETLKSILSKNGINANEIEKVRLQIKKHTNPNKINSGSQLIFTIKKTKDEIIELNKIIIPVSKAINVLVYRDEENNFVSEKIITKLYKKVLIAENIISSSLYQSALKANLQPEIIIEFARIFGFEIDFQRDIRKDDTVRIL